MFMLLAPRVAEEQIEAHAAHDAESMARRNRLIDEILEINHSAVAEFLQSFDEQALEVYARRLRFKELPRGRMARWTGPDGEPGVVARETID